MTNAFTCPDLYAPPSRPGAMDAYRLPSRYGDRLEPLKGHKAAATISRERS